MGPLYRQVAAEIVKHIEQGIYAPSERLPGVRGLARSRGVSIATVVAAYQLLTDEGYIDARPRSGFYVRARHTSQIAANPAAKATAPRLVTGQQMAMALIKASNDPRIVQLGAAVPDPSFLPTKAIGRALSQVMRTNRLQASAYMMPPGAAELRRQIARRMRSSGASVSTDDIVITTGCQEALSLALRAVTRTGDVVAIESPAFYGLLHVLESLGLEALEIPAHPSDGISLEALKSALERWPIKACVMSPNVSNPLGYCMSNDNKLALIRLLGEHNIPLIEDDVYGDLAFSGRRLSTCKGLAPQADILYCSSFSKSLSPGLRIGWIAAGRHHERVEYLKYVSSIASPTAPQLAVADLLASGRYERYLREVRGKYQSAVARMSAAVVTIFPEGTRISQPQGGFLLWVELPGGTDSMALARSALQSGVSIAPGPLFSASGKFGNFMRLSCARLWDARLEKALLALAKLGSITNGGQPARRES